MAVDRYNVRQQGWRVAAIRSVCPLRVLRRSRQAPAAEKSRPFGVHQTTDHRASNPPRAGGAVQGRVVGPHRCRQTTRPGHCPAIPLYPAGQAIARRSGRCEQGKAEGWEDGRGGRAARSVCEKGSGRGRDIALQAVSGRALRCIAAGASATAPRGVGSEHRRSGRSAHSVGDGARLSSYRCAREGPSRHDRGECSISGQ
jgi:hypothetical protein